MDLKYARQLTEELLQFYKLTGWRFEFRDEPRSFGLCNHQNRIVALSYVLTYLNEVPEVFSTVTHEIAHALVGPGHKHDIVWRRMFLSMGGDGKRCYDPNDIVMAPTPFVYRCVKCGYKIHAWRRKLMATLAYCTDCYKASGEDNSAMSRGEFRFAETRNQNYTEEYRRLLWQAKESAGELRVQIARPSRKRYVPTYVQVI